MRTSLNPFMYEPRGKVDWVKGEPGAARLILQPGNYKMSLCGGGGAGGTNGANSDNYSGGNGGAGAKGELLTRTITLGYGASVQVTVPRGGLTRANGGNGAAGGTNGSRYADGVNGGNGNVGAGGGGGYPAIIQIDTRQNAYYWGMGIYTLDAQWNHQLGNTQIYNADGKTNVNWARLDTFGAFERYDGVQYQSAGAVLSSIPTTIVLVAEGGGGGGGGGNATWIGRYASGGGGGGGGGYYFYNQTTGQVVSIPGQPGVRGAGGGNGSYSSISGLTGNTSSWPGIYAGRGGATNPYPTIRPMAQGGGASGGGGAYGTGNHSSAQGGAGGGGAGGSPDAGGGTAGGGGDISATNGQNPHTEPTKSQDPWGNTVSVGYGTGGRVNQNGGNGWVRIQQL